MEDHQMTDEEPSPSKPLSPAPSSDVSSISHVSDPIINWNIIFNETQKIPKSFGINTNNRVVKSQKHVKKSDVKISSNFKKIIAEFENVQTRLDTLTQRLDSVITNSERDRKFDKAIRYNEYSKLYNKLLKGDNARLHSLVIVESDDITEIGNPIPNGPDKIQDIKSLSLVDAEKILKYFGFQNFNNMGRGAGANRHAIKSLLMQNEVRNQYGLA
ncbi:hypothetical protein BTUL_0104g00210 [Botrytis tulipae]|uniref:Uncharacterized protein n=1 Tax=Botrytis tulipae TaxID=87230 RepID=A0A4Z1EH82_9HELO|nr:hypothetical protein BTUL_0104g00210 [Botrytis tulipae]